MFGAWTVMQGSACLKDGHTGDQHAAEDPQTPAQVNKPIRETYLPTNQPNYTNNTNKQTVKQSSSQPCTMHDRVCFGCPAPPH